VREFLVCVPEPFASALRSVVFRAAGRERGRQPFGAAPSGHDLGDELLHVGTSIRRGLGEERCAVRRPRQIKPLSTDEGAVESPMDTGD
jgi:hypothetical protein